MAEDRFSRWITEAQNTLEQEEVLHQEKMIPEDLSAHRLSWKVALRLVAYINDSNGTSWCFFTLR